MAAKSFSQLVQTSVVGGPAQHLLTSNMGNSPSIPGLGGGRPHVRRDHGYADSDRGRRPEQMRDTDIEEDEEVKRGVDIVNVPDIYKGHNGAQGRGALMSSDVAPTNEAARQMGRQAIEVNAVASRAEAASRPASKPASEVASKPARTAASTVASTREATMCDEITSNENDERDMNWRNSPFRVTEVEHRSGGQSDKSDSSSVESVHPPELRSSMELSGQGINGQRRSMEDLRAELSNEL